MCELTKFKIRINRYSMMTGLSKSYLALAGFFLIPLSRYNSLG